jgi:hypothetical protein
LTVADAALIRRYGQPEMLNTAATLRALGLRDKFHPRDVAAIRYTSVEAANAFAKANREAHDLDVLGPFETPAGPVNILDFRRNYTAGGKPVTDPLLPDDWTPRTSIDGGSQ